MGIRIFGTYACKKVAFLALSQIVTNQHQRRGGVTLVLESRSRMHVKGQVTATTAEASQANGRTGLQGASLSSNITGKRDETC